MGLLSNLSASFDMSATTIETNNATGILMFGNSSGAIFSGTVIDDNGVDIQISASSSLQVSGSFITNNVGIGVAVNRYSFINMFDPKNTIEGNSVDVVCNQSGGLSVSSLQTSTTGTTSISADCIVDGTIF